MDQSGRCGPVGVLVGHTEGITHVDAKGDGRWVGAVARAGGGLSECYWGAEMVKGWAGIYLHLR